MKRQKWEFFTENPVGEGSNFTIFGKTRGTLEKDEGGLRDNDDDGGGEGV